MSGIVLQITPQPLTVVLFAIYCSLIIILFDSVYPAWATDGIGEQPVGTRCALYVLV